jgi:hypothetical protein
MTRGCFVARRGQGPIDENNIVKDYNNLRWIEFTAVMLFDVKLKRPTGVSQVKDVFHSSAEVPSVDIVVAPTSWNDLVEVAKNSCF